jgi:hypothetical protein
MAIARLLLLPVDVEPHPPRVDILYEAIYTCLRHVSTPHLLRLFLVLHGHLGSPHTAVHILNVDTDLLCMDMCIDMCIDMYINMCKDMCTCMCIPAGAAVVVSYAWLVCGIVLVPLWPSAGTQR